MDNLNNMNNIDDINIMDGYVEIINIFNIYYKSLYNTELKEHLFNNINIEDDTDTNRQMELLYEFMDEYKVNENKNKELIELYDLDNFNIKCDKLYGLIIDSEIIKVSPSIFSLFIYLQQEEWININWKIMILKDN
jgi:hypothetical protein